MHYLKRSDLVSSHLFMQLNSTTLCLFHNVDPFAIELKHRGFKDREIHALIGNHVYPLH